MCYSIIRCGSELSSEEVEYSWQQTLSSYVQFYLCLVRWCVCFILFLQKWLGVELESEHWETALEQQRYFSRNHKILLNLTRVCWNWSRLFLATSYWLYLPFLNSCILCFSAWAQTTSLCPIAIALKCLVFSSMFQNCWRGELLYWHSLCPLLVIP